MLAIWPLKEEQPNNGPSKNSIVGYHNYIVVYCYVGPQSIVFMHDFQTSSRYKHSKSSNQWLQSLYCNLNFFVLKYFVYKNILNRRKSDVHILIAYCYAIIILL